MSALPSQRNSADPLLSVCQLAEELAKRRGEKVASAHVLMAIASRANPATQILDTFRVSAPKLEAWAGSVPCTDKQRPGMYVRQAREIAERMRAPEARELHLLLALVSDRTNWACQLLEKCAVQVPRLRTALTQVATGSRLPRRSVTAPTPAPSLSGSRSNTAKAVNLIPEPRGPREPSRGASNAPSRTRAPKAPPKNTRATPVRPQVGEPTKQETTAKPAPTNGLSLVKAKGKTPGRFSLGEDAFPVLSSLAENLTETTNEDIVGRHDEVQRVLDILAKKKANNPLLLGTTGVGKTSIIRGVARLVQKSAPGSADDRILLSISLADLVSGTGIRGALAEKFATIRKELELAQGRIVLVFEDTCQLFGRDIHDEIGQELRAALQAGSLPCIGVAHPDELPKMGERDPGLLRAFEAVHVGEPPRDEALAMVARAAALLGKHHQSLFPDESIAAAVDWSARYMPGRALPEKAIGILDMAAARSRRRGKAEVLPDTVARVVSEWTEVPVERLLESDAKRMLALPELLGQRVIGHKPMLERIAAVLRRNAAGLGGRRPIGSFLLLGPTGVGKTETAKAIAEVLFQSQDAMTRLDLSEFAESHSIARLIGAPPGYVGHEAGGQLTDAVQKRPYQVVLLDEIEKAHRDVLEAFLQVFDEGRLTDGKGTTVDFTNTVILLTSNLGAGAAVKRSGGGIGFQRAEVKEPECDHQAVLSAARKALPPELYNRFDEVLVFEPLKPADVRAIAAQLLDQLSQRLEQQRGIRISAGDGVLQRLMDLGGYVPELGARPMKRAIGTHVEAPLAELILGQALRPGATVEVVLKGDGLALRAA